MLSINNVSRDGALTYYQVEDNYYTKAAGYWYGQGADSMGVNGKIKKNEFEKILSGQDLKGNQLIQSGRDADGNEKHRAGIDLTFSAPKSVSILAEIMQDKQVAEAHEKAVKKSMDYVQEHFSQARKTVNGQTFFEPTNNLIVAMFTHDTSRELDPQTHTHCVVMNMTQRNDEKWRAVSNELLYKSKMLGGQIYRNELALSLKKLGYEIEVREKGLFDVKGMPENLMEEFSKRTKQIEERYQQLRIQFPKEKRAVLRKQAALDTREIKKYSDLKETHEEWKNQFEAFGYRKEELSKQLKSQEKTQDQKLNHVTKALKILTEKESVVSKKDILTTAMRLSMGQKTIDDIENDFRKSNKLQLIDKGKELYTSAEITQKEYTILNMLKAGKNQFVPTKSDVNIKQYNFTTDQAKAYQHIIKSRDRFLAIQGDAGSGKTYMLGRAKETLEKAGYEVIGLSVTGKAVTEMTKEGIQSETIDNFLLSHENGKNMNARIYLVDEASMLGTRKTDDLLKKLSLNDRAVFIGDYKQNQSIEAGNVFTKTIFQHKALDMVELKEAVRFKTKITRTTAEYVSSYQTNQAIDYLHNKNRIKITYSLNDIADKYVSLNNSMNKKNIIAVVNTNTERKDLNNEIRNRLISSQKVERESVTLKTRQPQQIENTMRCNATAYKTGDRFFLSEDVGKHKAGAVGEIKEVNRKKDEVTVTIGKEKKLDTIRLTDHGESLSVYREEKREISKQDKVMFLKNDKMLDIKNGQTGTIKEIDNKGNITIEHEDGRSVKFNEKQYNYMDHGYATTSTKSQGTTADIALVKADKENTTYNSFYVATSRAREDVYVFTNDIDGLKKQAEKKQEKTSTLDYTHQKMQEKSFDKIQQQKIDDRGLSYRY